MSSHHNRRKRRQVNETPILVERVQKHEQQAQEGGERLTYEEANWAKLSPTFRATHNRLRQARGLPTLPPPKVDLYVAPPKPLIRTFDPTDKEFLAATAEFRRDMMGGGSLMGGGLEGFTIDGKTVKL